MVGGYYTQFVSSISRVKTIIAYFKAKELLSKLKSMKVSTKIKFLGK